MTPRDPSAGAMEAALRCINKLPLRAMLDGRATNAAGVIAAEIDAFAAAAVEAERAACEAALERLLDRASKGDLSIRDVDEEHAAIAARRSKG